MSTSWKVPIPKSEVENFDVCVLADEDVILPLADLDDLAADGRLDAEAVDLVLAEVADQLVTILPV